MDTAATDLQTFVRLLGGLVVPKTGTPGGNLPSVSEFVIRAAESGMAGASPETFAKVESGLTSIAGRPFARISRQDQESALRELDSTTDWRDPNAPWPIAKRLILRGYYNSQEGATQELRYEPVPGRFLGAVEIGDDDVAYSSDLWARLFG